MSKETGPVCARSQRQGGERGCAARIERARVRDR